MRGDAKAELQSGYAADCKSVYAGSIPTSASIHRFAGVDRQDKKLVYAGIAQLVEHDLAKVGVEGSSPFSRSSFMKMRSDAFGSHFFCVCVSKRV